MLSLSSTGTAVNVVHTSACPDIGPVCFEREEPPHLHDQQFYVGELRAVAEYAFTDALRAEVQLPFRLTRTTITYRRLDGTAFTPDFAGIHHRNETLAGLGDPWLSVRPSVAFGSLRLTGRLGVTLPLGHTEENPFELGRAGLVHQHLQFGTGTFNPVLSVEAVQSFARVALRAHAQGRFVLYENGHGYRAGDLYAAGLEAEAPVWGPLTVALGAEVVSERPERWNGRIEQDGNLGRTDVLAGLTTKWKVGSFFLHAGARVPVYQAIVENGDEAAQLRYPVVVDVGVSRPFSFGR